MSAVLPAREPVARRVPPTGAELLESRHEWLRPSYFACVDSAGSVEAQEAFVDDEFAYQDGELNRVYHEKLATLSLRDQKALREIYQLCVHQIYSDRACKKTNKPTHAHRPDINKGLHTTADTQGSRP